MGRRKPRYFYVRRIDIGRPSIRLWARNRRFLGGDQWAQHGCGTFWVDANGVPWSAKYISCLGDPITDLVSNMAAEQRARSTYEHLIAATCDPHVKDMLRFLWEREVVHFQRFGEANLTNLSRFLPKINRQDFHFLTVFICSRVF